jgi:hypothetical protein
VRFRTVTSRCEAVAHQIYGTEHDIHRALRRAFYFLVCRAAEQFLRARWEPSDDVTLSGQTVV